MSANGFAARRFSDTGASRRRSHATSARSAREACHARRRQNREPDHDLKKIGGKPEEVETVLQHRQKNDAKDDARNRADAASEARPAEHGGGQHVEFVADES